MSISELDLEMDKRKMKVMCDEGDSPPACRDPGHRFLQSVGSLFEIAFSVKSIAKFLLTSVGPEFPILD